MTRTHIELVSHTHLLSSVGPVGGRPCAASAASGSASDGPDTRTTGGERGRAGDRREGERKREIEG